MKFCSINDAQQNIDLSSNEIPENLVMDCPDSRVCIRKHVMSLKPLAEGILSFLGHASRSMQAMTLQFDSPNV